MKKILISVLVLLLLLGVDFYSVSTTQTTPNLTKMFFTQNEEMSFLSAGSVTTDKETVHQGETIDVYVALETDSIGWAVFFDIQNGVNLISNEQTIPTFEHNEEGSGGEIFYAQPEAPYTTYEVGTFIAAKQYTVSETAQLGSYITINVSGILLDEDWETHDIYGSVTVQVIGRINDDGLTIRYAEKDNLTNELYSTKRDGVRIGSDEEYTVPEDYIFNDGLWRTEDYGDKIHTITEGINIITIEYEKVLEDVTINYVEEGNSENILYTEIIEDIQVGLQCNYANPKDYTKNNLLWRTENYGERDYTVIEGENIIIIEYEKVLEDVTINYVEKGNTTNILYTETTEDIQVGETHNYANPKDYTKNNLLWRTEDYGEKDYTVIEGENEIIIEYGKVLEDVTINYVEKGNTTNILYTETTEDIQVGTIHNYTVPKDYIKSDLLWRIENFGSKTYTVIEGENKIIVEYEKVLEDVTINYVEKGNTTNILYTETTEDIQVGETHNYANPKDYTKNNLLWRTENYGERDYTVIESENIIIIEYEKVLKDIIIMYAEEYTTNELYTTTIKDIQAGTEYEYIIEEDYIKNGLLWRTEDFGTKTYTVTDGINIIVVGYKKVLEDITINYVEEGNNENILYTRTVEDIQVGTVYSYTVPEIYTDAEHIEWILIETTNLNRNYKVEEGTNIVLVEYEKVLKDVVIRYVEKGNPANVLYSTKQESIRIGTDCEYTVEEDYIKDGLLWRTTNYGTKTYKVVGGTNIITIEYEKVLKDVTINYVEKDNHANVVETITEKIQAGTQYEYLVPKDYTKNNLLWRTTDFGNKTYTVIEGENEIIVEYVKVLANIVIKYIDTEKKSVIVYTISEEDIQVGTIYSYTVPTIHIDEEETQWILIDQTSLDRNYTIEEGNNEILIEYIKEYAIILDKISITMEKGSTKIIIATIEPEDSTERTLIWSSEDINIASVDQDGVVTGIATGTTIITVITENGYRKAECTVTVKNNITEIIDEVFEMVEEEGKTYITNILEKTKVEDVKEVLDLDGYIVEIVNSKQEELELDDYVGTGSILRITDEETGVTKEYIIIVKGDVDGDGKVTATDLAKIRRHLAEIELLEGIFKKGAGMTTWGEVTATDLAKTRRHLAGIEHIK